MLSSPLSIVGWIWGASELLFALKRRSKAGSASKDGGSLQVIWIVCVVSIALAILAAKTMRSFRFPASELVNLTGSALFLLGIAIRWYAIIYLGRFFTPNVAIVENHRIIDTGPYRFVRHPTYTGFLLIFLGIGLRTGNIVSFLIIIVPITAVMLWRIRIEEAALLGAFGDQYLTYMQKTKRLIPLIY